MIESTYFTEEHEQFRDQVRRFLADEVAPHAAAWESARRIPRKVFTRMGEMGLLGITTPEAYGGSAGDIFFAVTFLEELPRSLMGGFCAAVSVQQFMATPHILRFGSEELKVRYVTPSVSGRYVGALAITEPDTGSDVAAIRTTAVRDGDDWVVNGAKTFITNGAEGDFYTLAARTRQEEGAGAVSLLVVDAQTPGVRVTRRLNKLGWHSSDTAEIVFEDVRVPAENLIGDEGDGFAMIMDSFPLERLCSAAIAVGSADVALEKTLEYMASRRAFGRPLDRFQALRHRLADLAAELEAARQLTYHTAWLHGRGKPAIRESSMAKLVSTELGKRVADECLQFHGGYGYMEEFPVARFYRDARGATITAGTSEIMREIIARFTIDDFDPPRPAATGERRGDASDIGGDGDSPREPERRPARADAAVTVESLMRSLPGRLRPERTQHWEANFHYRVKGADKPEWTIRIARGECIVSEGHDGDPDCVVRLAEETYLGIADGTVNPQTAFITGRVKASDLGQMMRFVKAFRPAD